MSDEVKKHPLWMPEGSVRAVLVLGALLTVIVPVFVYVFKSEDIPQGVKEVVILIAGGSLSLIKDYITHKSKTDDVEQ